MRESALAARRRALVEQLVKAAIENAPVTFSPKEFLDSVPSYEARLRINFTALLASRWQT